MRPATTLRSAILLAALTVGAAHAQFFTPNGPVLEEGRVMVMLAGAWQPGSNWTGAFNPVLQFGLAKPVDVLIQPGAANFAREGHTPGDLWIMPRFSLSDALTVAAQVGYSPASRTAFGSAQYHGYFEFGKLVVNVNAGPGMTFESNASVWVGASAGAGWNLFDDRVTPYVEVVPTLSVAPDAGFAMSVNAGANWSEFDGKWQLNLCLMGNQLIGGDPSFGLGVLAQVGFDTKVEKDEKGEKGQK